MSLLVACCALTGCGSKIADNTEHFDKITKTLKLSKLYEGKRLMEAGGGGIEEAKLIGETTDGDTSNFSLVGGGSVTVRYQGVDTPESTADVQKWGKAASNFTNERLAAATTIVLESTTGDVPKVAVGQRSLCYVWYKTETDDFKCLNVELVENGYSYNKEDATNSYYSYFQKAEEFARSIELRLFSKLDDPLFDTAIRPLSIKDLKEHPENYESNMKVKLDAYVCDRYEASGGAVTLTVAQYDEETGKAYELELYAGYVSSTGRMQVGDLYHIVATLDKHNGSWQIKGVNIDNDNVGKDDKAWRSQKGYYLIFDASNDFFVNFVTVNCYGNVTVTSANLDGKTLTFTGTAPERGEEGTTDTFTFTVTVPDSYNNTIKEGSVLSISGCYQFEAKSGKLTVPDFSKITIKK